MERRIFKLGPLFKTYNCGGAENLTKSTVNHEEFNGVASLVDIIGDNIKERFNALQESNRDIEGLPYDWDIDLISYDFFSEGEHLENIHIYLQVNVFSINFEKCKDDPNCGEFIKKMNNLYDTLKEMSKEITISECLKNSTEVDSFDNLIGDDICISFEDIA